MGWLICHFERLLRKAFRLSEQPEQDRGRKRFAGFLLVLLTEVTVTGSCLLVLRLLERTIPVLVLPLEVAVCAQCLAARSMVLASSKVEQDLKAGDLERARKSVSMIVGRETASLSLEGVAKAAVESTAESASDGVIAPLFYLTLFGIPGGLFYKAANTMDSMIGYRNDRYRYFGTAAARLDDILNFVPSRIAGMTMIVSAALLRLDAGNALRMFKRDRGKHLSPNAGQTESAMAGALDVQLGGDAVYFGQLVRKSALGDPIRDITPDDIGKANRMLAVTSALDLVLALSCLLVLEGLLQG